MDIKVAIFEDNKLVRDALQSILNGTPGYACVGAFDSGRHWQQELLRCHADVVLMDIEMPGRQRQNIQSPLRRGSGLYFKNRPSQ